MSINLNAASEIFSDQQPVIAALPGPLEVQPARQKGTPKTLAERTRFIVDDEALGNLQKYGDQTISKWAGKDLREIYYGLRNIMCVCDGNKIDANAPKKIFDKLSLNQVVVFGVDPIICHSLQQIPPDIVESVSNELGIKESAFRGLASGKITTITKEDAEKYNRAFRRHNVKEVFDLERIFTLAKEEEIVKKTKTEAHIKIDPDQKDDLKGISGLAFNQLKSVMGRDLDYIRDKTNTVLLKYAILINEIVRINEIAECIFVIKKEFVQKYSICQKQIEELTNLNQHISDKVTRKLINKITNGKKRFVSPGEVEKLNPYLKENPFDYESLKLYAEQEAEELKTEALKASTDRPKKGKRGVKRPNNGTALESNRKRSKKQPLATVADEQQSSAFIENGFPHPHPTFPPLVQNYNHEIPPEQVYNEQSTLIQQFVTPELGFTFTSEAYETQSFLPEQVYNEQSTLIQQFVIPEFDFTFTSGTYETQSSLPEEPFSSLPIDSTQYFKDIEHDRWDEQF